MKAAGVPQPRFESDTGFFRELKRRVDAYFDGTGLRRRDNPQMYLKTAVILTWCAASYGLLVFAAATWWQAVPLALSLALASTAIGFSVQHDGNHGAYSRSRIVNGLMGGTLDVMGASSYVWHWKHNIFHHTYTNLSGADEDINVGLFGRLSPVQPHRGIYRLQQFYLFGLYGFMTMKWQLFDDFKNIGQGRIAENRFPRPRRWGLFGLVGGKVIFAGWAFVLPMFFHAWWKVLLFYGGTAFIGAVVTSVVFQLAHCVETSTFPAVPASGKVSNTWAIHQVETTVNFSPRNRWLTWYLGGLNYQIEHHLFPKICHVHYPKLSRIVEAVCNEHGVRYNAYGTLLPAMSSHWRWLREMGRGPARHPHPHTKESVARGHASASLGRDDLQQQPG
ncbi:MAG TPA: acyl-CoA desaturase [Polyangia bacterium]|jgi:linoleoyl-CoA desaturase